MLSPSYMLLPIISCAVLLLVPPNRRDLNLDQQEYTEGEEEEKIKDLRRSLASATET